MLFVSCLINHVSPNVWNFILLSSKIFIAFFAHLRLLSIWLLFLYVYPLASVVLVSSTKCCNFLPLSASLAIN